MKFVDIVDNAFAESASTYTLTGYNLERVLDMMAEDALEKYQSQLHEVFKTEFRRMLGDYSEMLKGLHVKND